MYPHHIRTVAPPKRSFIRYIWELLFSFGIFFFMYEGVHFHIVIPLEPLYFFFSALVYPMYRFPLLHAVVMSIFLCKQDCECIVVNACCRSV